MKKTLMRPILLLVSATLAFLAPRLGLAADLTLSTTQTLAPGTYTYDNIVIQSGGKLIVQGDTATNTGVTINAINITVASGGSISADGQGFPHGSTTPGPGQGGNSATGGGGGGGHGGVGTSYGTTGGAGGGTYGSDRNPITLGSGGGDGKTSTTPEFGGAGGGAIRLIVSGTLILNGSITADGTANVSTAGGGGAGGSIWITAGTIQGTTGRISASGGSGTNFNSGFGAGGRIAVYYDTFDRATQPIVFTTSANNLLGTLYLIPNAGFGGDFKCDYKGMASYTTAELAALGPVGNVIVNNGCDLTVTGDLSATSVTIANTAVSSYFRMMGNLTVSGDISLPTSYGRFFVPGDTGTKTGRTITAVNLTIANGSQMNADGLGFPASTGDGAGGDSATGGAGGGGHGGSGGFGTNTGAGGAIYGDDRHPITLGSGGGTGLTSTTPNAGGAGGGAIKLIISGATTLYGFISANGLVGVGNSSKGGGGAGGSIWLDTGTLLGNGYIQAYGGNGTSLNSGGGGGGRIAVYYNTFDRTANPIVFHAGYSSSGYRGTSGPVYLANKAGFSGDFKCNYLTSLTLTPADLPSLGALIIDNGCNLTINGNLNAASVTVGPGTTYAASLSIAGDLTVSGDVVVTGTGGKLVMVSDTDAGTGRTLTAPNLTLTNSGKVTADGLGYAAATGLGAGGNHATGGGGGGGHGGIGGTASTNGVGGGIYGDDKQPITLGSGGGNGSTSATLRAGGAGGGAIKLVISGITTVDGIISANGAQGSTYTGYGGGGAGGSIWLDTGTLQGAAGGIISAIGGNPGGNTAGGGAGGRVAIYFNSFDRTSSPISISAATSSNAVKGTPGPVWLINKNGSSGDFTCDYPTTLNLTPADLPSLGNLVIDKGCNIKMTGDLSPASVTIGTNAGVNTTSLSMTGNLTSSGDITLAANTYTKLNVLGDTVAKKGYAITAPNITIGAGASLNADGNGFTASLGDGKGLDHTTSSAGGGGHGGTGGTGSSAGLGGATYGSDNTPITLGSGGGTGQTNTTSSLGGNGGGAIKLTVSGTTTVNGTLSANGNRTVGTFGGGGAGGSIWVNTGALAGSGSIMATGGNSLGLAYGGAGGGGRIAIYYSSKTYSGTPSVAAGVTGRAGVAGTLVQVDKNVAIALSFSTQPSTTDPAGSNLTTQPVVNTVNLNNAVDVSWATAVALAAYTDSSCTTPASGTLTGSSTLTNGVATFTGVNFSEVGTYYLKASSGPLTTACSQGFYQWPPAVELAFTTQPSSTAVAGSNFSQQPAVSARDASHTLVGNYTGAITISAYTDSNCQTAASGGILTGSATTASGVANFSNVSYTVAGNLYLKATSGALSSACSSVIAVSAASASKVSFTTQPSATGSAVANLAQQPVVKVRDTYNNQSITYVTDVTLSAYTDDTCQTAVNGGTFSGSANTIAGVAEFSGVKYNRPGTIYLKASSGGLTTDCSQAITISSGSATSLAFSPQPSSAASAGANLSQQPVITAYDSEGNTATSFVSTLTLGAYTDDLCTAPAAGGILTGSNSTTAGVATFSNVSYTKAASIYLLATSGGLSVCSNAVTISPATPDHLSFDTEPSSTGRPSMALTQQPLISARDAFDNLDPNFTTGMSLAAYTDSTCSTPVGTGTLASNSASTTAGVASFSGVSFSAIAVIYLKATAGGLGGCSSAVSISSNAATQLIFATEPSASSTAGVNLSRQPVVHAVDNGNQVDISYSAAITVSAYTDNTCSTAAEGTLSGSASVTAGVGQFSNVKYTKAETIWLKASSGTLTTACSSALAVSAAPIDHLSLKIQPSTTAIAGFALAQQPIVEARDAFENIDASYSAAISLAAYKDASCASTPGSGVLGGTGTFSSGTAAYSDVSYSESGTLYLKFTSGSFTTCAQAVAVSSAAAAKLVFTTNPSSTGTAGISLAQQPVLEIRDSLENIVASYVSAVQLSPYSDSNCSTLLTGGTLSQTFASPTTGIATFTTVSYSKPATLYLKAYSGGLTTACSPAITLAPGAGATLSFSVQPSANATAGQSFSQQPAVTVLDTLGNTATAYASNIVLTTYQDSECTTPVAGTLSNASAAPSSGVASFAGVAFNKSGNLYLKASSGGLVTSCSSAISVSAAAASKLFIVTQPAANATAGVSLTRQPVLQALDANDNLSTTFGASVSVTAYTDNSCSVVASGALSGTTSTTAGQITGSALRYGTAERIYLGFASSGLTSACSEAIDIASGTAASLSFTTAPSSSNLPAQNFSQLPVVTAYDSLGNIASAYSTAITLAAYSDSACATPVSAGILTVTGGTPLSGVTSFTSVMFSRPATIYLKANSGAITPACSSAITITGGPATHLVFATQPASTATAGSALTRQPIISAQDDFDMQDPNLTSLVSLAVYTDASCTTAAVGGILSGASLSATAGSASFNTLSYTRSGTYYFKATSGALTSACSSAISIHAAAASSLSFALQPSASTKTEMIFSQQPTIIALDVYGNSATLADTITLSPTTDISCSQAATGVLSSNSAAASGSSATFTSLKYSKVGTIYLKATTGALTPGCSSAIVVSLAPMKNPVACRSLVNKGFTVDMTTQRPASLGPCAAHEFPLDATKLGAPLPVCVAADCGIRATLCRDVNIATQDTQYYCASCPAGNCN